MTTDNYKKRLFSLSKENQEAAENLHNALAAVYETGSYLTELMTKEAIERWEEKVNFRRLPTEDSVTLYNKADGELILVQGGFGYSDARNSNRTILEDVRILGTIIIPPWSDKTYSLKDIKSDPRIFPLAGVCPITGEVWHILPEKHPTNPWAYMTSAAKDYLGITRRERQQK